MVFHELFERRVDASPDAIALRWSGGQLTYRELDRLANNVAHRLRTAGVRAGQIIGLCTDRSPEMVAGMLGVMKAGCAYMPLDPEYPTERLRWMLDDAQVSYLVTVERMRQSTWKDLRVVLVDAADASTASRLPPTASPDDLAYVIYTSGSTGTPKGVGVSQRSLVGLVETLMDAYQLTPGDRVFQHASFCWDTSCQEIFPTLASGATLVLRDSLPVESVDAFLRTCRRYELTVLLLPTAYWHELVLELTPQSKHDLATVRLVLIGGEEARADRLERWWTTVGHTIRLANEYGATETTAVTLMCDLTASALSTGRVPLGRPIAGVEVHILNDMLDAVPIGVTGELYVGGHGVSRGYLRRPGLTSERYIPHPFEAGQRLYRTGDRARWTEDGNVVFMGRVDHQVKLRGIRIELGEIEAAIAAHPEIKDVAVVMRADAHDHAQLVGYVVPHGDQLSIEALRDHLKQRLPDYMVPAAYVKLAALPLTASHKVDRAALPAPSPDAYVVHLYAAPRDDLERRLAGLWGEVLGVERVGLHDNFFDLGGDSILAIQLSARAKNAKLAVSPRLVFKAPTLAELADEMRKNDTGPVVAQAQHPEGTVLLTSPIRPRAPAKLARMSFMREFRYLFSRRDLCNFDNYVDVSMLIGKLDIPALEAALNDVIHRQEILRARVVRESGRLFERIVPISETPALQLQVDEAADSDALNAIASAEYDRTFDLETDPRLRARLVRVGEREHALIMTLDHMYSDVSGIRALWRDLETAYIARRERTEPRFAPLAYQASDFDAWQRQLVLGPDGAQHINYWRRKLEGCLPSDLATDRPRPSGPARTGLRSSTADSVIVALPLAPVLEAARRLHASPFALTLAGLSKVFARRLKQDEVTFHSTYMHRDRPGAADLVGCFGNSLLMRQDLRGAPDLATLVARTMTTVDEAFANSFAPLLTYPDQQPELPFRQPLISHDCVRINFNYVPQAKYQTPRFADLEVGYVPTENRRGAGAHTRFDFIFSVRTRDTELLIQTLYNNTLFDVGTVQQLAGEYAETLQSITALQ